MKKYIEITKINYIKEFQLEICFNNDSNKIIDLEQYINHSGGVFKQLQNTDQFKKFKIDMAGGISWECGADLAPDMLINME